MEKHHHDQLQYAKMVLSKKCGMWIYSRYFATWSICQVYGGRSDVLSLYMSQFSFLNSTSLCAHIGFSGVSYQ